MKKIKKILAISLVMGIFLPNLSYGDQIVAYDKSDLDLVLILNGIKVNEKEVNDRKNLEIQKQATESENKVLHPKTAVYSNVVDISEHQNSSAIDYDKFAKDIDGAILRSSITTYKEDEETKEKTFYIRKDLQVDKHYENLNKRNVPIGFYHYSRATNEKEAIMEANYVLDYIKDKNISLPIYIDIEDDIRQAKTSKENLSKAADAFVMAIKRNGYVSGIYSYPYFAKNHLTKEVRNKNEFWIADYNSKDFTAYKDTDFDAWQYDHKGKVDGYNGNIDKNILYKDYPMIIKGKTYKDMDKLAKEVIDGKWSYGKERQRRLAYAGYDYKKIQEEVNKRLSL